MNTGIILLLAFFSLFKIQYADSNLSNEEKKGILLMREEEKLAHDVYLSLFEKWNIPVFNNIANSEIRHFNAMGYLIEQFEIIDPAQAGIGNFHNKDIKHLYDSLTEKGSHSIIDALEVGAFIEEVDIEDLQNQISSVRNDTIIQVYENLLRASGNHLRAFTGQLSARNNEYTPKILSVEDYTIIIETPHQQGGGKGNCLRQQSTSANNLNGCMGQQRRRGKF